MYVCMYVCIYVYNARMYECMYKCIFQCGKWVCKTAVLVDDGMGTLADAGVILVAEGGPSLESASLSSPRLSSSANLDSFSALASLAPYEK